MCSFFVHFYIEYTPFENTKRWHGQNTFEILHLSDANMIGKHKEKRTKMTNRDTFLKNLDTNLAFSLMFPIKGQLNSEWIYEVIVSPKTPTENYRDFCPVSLLEGRAEISVSFGW